MSNRYALIGDVHGVLEPLVEIVGRAQNLADSIIFLGDYVNRGPQSREVLEFLVGLNESLAGRVHFLKGHHDQAFLDAIVADRLDTFLRMGGAATLHSYPGTDERGVTMPLQDRVPVAHVAFLRGLKPAFSDEKLLAMHDQSDAPRDARGRFGVFGHRPQLDAEPKVTDEFALIDTGCGTLPNGRLTCFLWPERTWIQAS